MREIFYHTRRFITNIKSEKKASDGKLVMFWAVVAASL